MHPVAVALLVSTAAYLGFQATIRWIVYPQFARVPAPAFAEYERRHQRAVTPVVGVLFAAEVVSVGLALLRGPQLPAALAAVGVATVLVTTALAAVPQHRRLSAGFAPEAHRRLLGADSVRVGAAAVSLGAAVWYALAA